MSDTPNNDEPKTETQKEKDLVVGVPPEGFKELKPIKDMAKMGTAKRIKWGEEYREWPIGKQLGYAQRLAASMNHAADVMQKERNALLVIARHQEEQLKQAALRATERDGFMQTEFSRMDAEKQALMQTIIEKQDMIKKLRQLIREEREAKATT